MFKIMFVCYGNICRSPMAEYLMKDLVKRKGRENDFLIMSSATSYEEIGNPIYPPVKRLLNSVGISCDEKRANKLQAEDYDKFDYFIIMDGINERGIKGVFPIDKDNKIRRLMSFTKTPHDIADPWYTREFDVCYKDIKDGVEGLYNYLISK